MLVAFPERLTELAARLVEVVREADVTPLAEELRTEELRTAAPLPVEEEARVRLLERGELLRETVDPLRMAVLPSRCPSWAAWEGSQRWPAPHSKP